MLRAKYDRGAVIMHIDPKFSRTSARSDFHVPLRSGTDIAFLGGMINYILENDLYFKEYVVENTNASFIVSKDFGFKDGLFSGFDPKKRKYDKKSWSFDMDAQGVPLRDKTLQDPRCVFQLLKKHYSRYKLDTVSAITGVPKDNLLKVYKAFGSTGKPDRSGTVMYALGWTQHTVGVQNIRSSAMVQLLLGNIGVAGGGINALRGEPNVQGSTDQAILWHILPGYNPVPVASQQTLGDYTGTTTPKSNDPMSANWWQHRPKYMVSMLKGYYGDYATKDNDFGYSWLPKCDDGVDYAYLYAIDRMYKGQIKGGFVFAHNPCQCLPNTHKTRRAMDNLDWLVVGELHHTETTDNWRRPGVDPTTVKTEVFLLPSAQRAEKAGSVTNSGRWVLWHYKAAEPMGKCKTMGDMVVDIFNRVRALYNAEGGVYPDPITKMDWPAFYDADMLLRKTNGWFTRDTEIKGKLYKKGQQVPSFTALRDDGSTACPSTGSSRAATPRRSGNKGQRRDLSQTPMQAKIGLYPNFSWCWPVNRRIIYNRASVDVNGKPWASDKPVIAWNGQKWEGDVPDGGWPPMASGQGTAPLHHADPRLWPALRPGPRRGALPRALRARGDAHQEPPLLQATQQPLLQVRDERRRHPVSSRRPALPHRAHQLLPDRALVRRRRDPEHPAAAGGRTAAVRGDEPRTGRGKGHQERRRGGGGKHPRPRRGRGHGHGAHDALQGPGQDRPRGGHALLLRLDHAGLRRRREPAHPVRGRSQHHHPRVQGLHGQRVQGRQGHRVGLKGERDAQGILHRHHKVHGVPGLSGGVQGVERP